MAALSARALAASAKAAGYAVLAVDMFDDLDLREHCERSVRIDGELSDGLARQALLAALENLASDRHPVGVLCGAGFEDRTAVLGDLAERWTVLGNRADAVRRAKDPGELAGLCGRLGIPHPDWSREPQGEGWLVKRRGASGGAHVGMRGANDTDLYWQEQAPGAPVSALVLGNGGAAKTLGLSTQWPDPAPGSPFRFGGAVRPAGPPSAVAAALIAAAEAVVAAAGLVGLNSVDFLVAGETWTLIEINPRPGATLDIFAPDDGALVALHIAACRGELPDKAPQFTGAAAAEVVYAHRTMVEMPAIAWPDWTADRQRPGTRVKAGEPLCTVLASADDPGGARRLSGERAAAIRSVVEAH